MATVLECHVVSTYVLGDASCLTGDDVGLADIVEQRGLTMVHMTHHGHDGCAGHQVFLIVLYLCHGLAHLGTHILSGESELLGHQIDSLGIHALIDADHDTDAHTCGDNLCHRHIHHGGQLIGSHKLCQLEHLALSCLCFHFVLHTLTDGIALLTTILGTLAHLATLVGQACQGLSYLLCYFLVAHLGLYGQRLALVLLFVLILTTSVLLSGVVVSTALALAIMLLHLAGYGIYIHALLAYAYAFLAVASSRSILTICCSMIALVTLTTLLFTALLAGTRAGVDGREVYLAQHLRGCQSGCVQAIGSVHF